MNTECHELQPIRRHRDGSIDYGYYLARGRKARSEQAYAAASSLRLAATRTAKETRRRLAVTCRLLPARLRTNADAPIGVL